MSRALLFALAGMTALTWSNAAAEPSDSPTTVVLTEGVVYEAKSVSMDQGMVTVVTTTGNTVEIARENVAYMSFQPDWLAIRAYGVKDNTYYDFGGCYALPLPPEEWEVSVDAEGHLFLHGGKITIGIYAYLARYADLDTFLRIHASWRAAQKMPPDSYTDGEEITIDGVAARSFSYESELRGAQRRIMDVKIVGPLGQACVMAISGSDISEEEFQAAAQQALRVVQRVRFFRAGS